MSLCRRLILLCSLALASGALMAQAPEAPATTQLTPLEGLSQPIQSPDVERCHRPDCIIAKRGTAVVTVADIMAKMNTLEKAQQDLFLSDAKQINKTIENMLILRQIANEADRAKAEQDVVLKARLNQVQDEVLAVYQLDQVRAQRIPGDFHRLAREYYLANKATMRTPKLVTVRHLLIDAKSRGDVLAKAMIETLAKDLKGADDKRFTDAVIESSEDPSKAANGGIMQLTEGNTDFDPTFAAAALGLTKIGEISAPVRSEFGYHLIQLVASTPSKSQTFEEAEPAIVKKLKEDAQRRVTIEYRSEVSAMGPLEVYPENLEGLVYGDDAGADGKAASAKDSGDAK